MGGESLVRADIDTDGIAGDRVWALRDVESGKLVSAKRPRLWRSMLDCVATGLDDEVRITLPDGIEFSITGGDAPVLLSEFLERKVTIERSDSTRQGVYASDWPEIEGVTLAGEFDAPTNITGRGHHFVDVEPLHIITTSSMKALATRDSSIAVDVRRFRPNLVIDTGDVAGFIENDWQSRTFSGPSFGFRVIDPTARCVMATVAQQELPRQLQVLQTLARENRVEYPIGSFAAFGVNAVVSSVGTVSIQDIVTSV